VLVALGLEACGETVSTCLSMMLTSEDDGGTSGTDASSDSPTESDVGPCLGQLPTTDDGDVDASSSSTDGSDTTGTGTTDGGTTESGSDDGAETSTSVCLVPPGDALPDGDEIASAPATHAAGWQAAFTRVAGKLPADVAARLSTKKGREP
jgi:hypothetical protein